MLIIKLPLGYLDCLENVGKIKVRYNTDCTKLNLNMWLHQPIKWLKLVVFEKFIKNINCFFLKITLFFLHVNKIMWLKINLRPKELHINFAKKE